MKIKIKHIKSTEQPQHFGNKIFTEEQLDEIMRA